MQDLHLLIHRQALPGIWSWRPFPCRPIRDLESGRRMEFHHPAPGCLPRQLHYEHAASAVSAGWHAGRGSIRNAVKLDEGWQPPTELSFPSRGVAGLRLACWHHAGFVAYSDFANGILICSLARGLIRTDRRPSLYGVAFLFVRDL